MKKLIIFLLVVVAFKSYSQKKETQSILVGKNFYLINALDRFVELKKVLPVLERNGDQIGDYLFTGAEIKKLEGAMGLVYDQNSSKIDELLEKYIRPSASYVLFDTLSNRQLWLKCWMMYYRGINQVIGVYGLGKKGRYPDVDSSSFDVKGLKYQGLLKDIVEQVKKQPEVPFYKRSLDIALGLLSINGRDEAARFELLEKGGNRLAYLRVKRTNFGAYAYSAILVPGEGPEDDAALSEGGRKRCDMAAERFARKLAPFILVSGGYVHPFGTKFCEALEMKKYLMEKYRIPESSIIMDPHARHTTTNFRNAGRLLIAYGFPLAKPSLCLTDKEQTDYIIDPQFGTRNLNELGYLPYRDLKRISDTEIEFFTMREVLFRDPIDPLDP